jgi:hypothetical protein
MMFGHQESVYERLFKSDDFKVYPPEERAEFLRLEEEAFRLRLNRKFELREQARIHKLRMHELRQVSRAKSRELRVKSVEIYFRTALTLLLISILAVAIVIGIIKGIPAGNLTQYLTPISGLAGIAIGYFFGRGSEVKQITLQSEPESAERADDDEKDDTAVTV